MMDRQAIEDIARKLDPHFPAQELTDEERAAACQALFDYADLRKKWDAVVNTEPVGHFDVYDDGNGGFSYIQVKPEYADATTVALIRKPERSAT